MRKYLAYGLLLLVCACTREGMEDQCPLELTFEAPVVGAATRAVAGEMGASYSIKEDFRVWGWYSPSALIRADATTNGSTPNGTAYFSDVKAFHTGSSLAHTDYWTLTPTYYWPKAGYLSFHALSPASYSGYGTVTHTWGTSGNPGLTITGFTVQDQPSDQIDLLYSNFIFNRQRSHYDEGNPYEEKDPADDNSQYVYNGVNLSFNHALSSVHFKIKVDRDYEIEGGKLRIFLKKIEVLHTYSAGNFSENRAANVLTNAYASGSGPLWSGQAAEKDYTLYTKGSVLVGGSTPVADIPMITNGQWHVARGVTVQKGVEIVFRNNGDWDDVLGHIKGQMPPYYRGSEFTVSPTGTDITVLDSGTYDILLNPSEKKARLIDAQADANYADYIDASTWGVHCTLGYKPNTTAVDLVQEDGYGNKFIGGHSLLMVPQSLSHPGSGNEVSLRLIYSVKGGDVEIETTKTVSLDALGGVSAWEPGKKYIYTVTLGMDKIILDPYVTVWTDKDPIY